MTPDDLAALATPIWGLHWQTPLARERGVAIRTVQRWAADGIQRPETAAAIRAYLLSRRVIDIPLPPQDSAEIDDAAHAAMHVIVGQILEAGSAIGWHRAELLTGLLADVRAQIDARQDQRSA